MCNFIQVCAKGFLQGFLRKGLKSEAGREVLKEYIQEEVELEVKDITRNSEEVLKTLYSCQEILLETKRRLDSTVDLKSLELGVADNKQHLLEIEQRLHNTQLELKRLLERTSNLPETFW